MTVRSVAVTLGTVVALLGVAIGAWTLSRTRDEPEPWPLPEVRLVDASGSAFDLHRLDGRVWIAGFFFTRCQSVCPRVIADQAGLARRLDRAGLARVHLVSISVDPAHDTPERLRAYGEARGIDFNRWSFLTGPPEEVRRLVESGFRVAMGFAPPAGVDLFDIAHTARFALVGPHGVVFGFYETDRAGLDALFADASRLAAKTR